MRFNTDHCIPGPRGFRILLCVLLMHGTSLAGDPPRSHAHGDDHPSPKYDGVPAPTTAEGDTLQRLVSLLTELAAAEKNPLLKRHFESVALLAVDTTHGIPLSNDDRRQAAAVLTYFQQEGAHWNTYLEKPRPLIMGFRSAIDGRYSYYWLILPNAFAATTDPFPLYLELHGSGGGSNNNPRKMLFLALQPALAGVPNQGFRKDGYYVYPWGRGDKGYRGVAEQDIIEVLADFDQHFKSDPRRQYLYGFSMGGAGAFHIARKTPDRWAAIATYSGAFRRPTTDDVREVSHLPIWMVWGENENQLTAENIRMKDLLLKTGALVFWEQIEGVGHQYLGTYQDKMLDWLSGHEKNR